MTIRNVNFSNLYLLLLILLCQSCKKDFQNVKSGDDYLQYSGNNKFVTNIVIQINKNQLLLDSTRINSSMNFDWNNFILSRNFGDSLSSMLVPILENKLIIGYLNINLRSKDSITKTHIGFFNKYSQPENPEKKQKIINAILLKSNSSSFHTNFNEDSLSSTVLRYNKVRNDKIILSKKAITNNYDGGAYCSTVVIGMYSYPEGSGGENAGNVFVDELRRELVLTGFPFVLNPATGMGIGIEGPAGLTSQIQSLVHSAIGKTRIRYPEAFKIEVLNMYTQCSDGSGSGSGPSTTDPGGDYEVITFDDGTDISDLLGCFSNIPNNGATYSAKICVDLPNNENPKALIGPDRVGHTFITLTKTNGGQTVTESFGFYPKTGYKSLAYFPVVSQIEDNGNHAYDAVIELTNLTATDFNAMIYKSTFLSANMQYDLNNYNCTDFAIQVINEGIDYNHQIVVPDWIGENTYTNYGTTPTGLYKKINEMKNSGDHRASTGTHIAPVSVHCN